VRLAVIIILLLQCAPVAATVTCDQLGNIALATEQYRNQGEQLQIIMAEANKLETGNNLSKDDMLAIRQTVQQTYDRTRTPLEIRKECKDAPVR
jgi:Flp pilus assembly protein CpaB